MKVLLSILIFIFLQKEYVRGQLYAENHFLWITKGKIPYYLVFQDSIAFLEIKPRKDGKGYHNYERLDTLSKLDSIKYVGKKSLIYKIGESWRLQAGYDDGNIAIFQLATGDQYSQWVSFVNWNQWIQVVRRARKLFPERYKDLSQEFILLEKRGHSTPILEYQREVQNFEKKYLQGK